MSRSLFDTNNRRTLMGPGRLATVMTLATLAIVAQAAPASAARAGVTCGDSWVSAAGGEWATGSNWSTAAPPTSSQEACITKSLSGAVVISGTTTVGGLVVGGPSGHSELEFQGNQALTVNGNTTIADTGMIVQNGAVKLTEDGTFSNHGVMTVTGLEFVGNLANAGDGLIEVNGGMTFDGPGTFTNSGVLSVPAGSNFTMPKSGNLATFINRGSIDNGTKVSDGTFDFGAGTTFRETTGTVAGSAPIIEGGALDIAGAGAARLEVTGASTITGAIAGDQTVVLAGGTLTATGSMTNKGTITLVNGTELSVGTGGTLTNNGLIAVPVGVTLLAAGNIDNGSGGRIDLDNSGGLTVSGVATLTNHGTISVTTSSTLSTGASGTIDNASGIIENDGQVTAPAGGTFQEGAGTTSGQPVMISGGALDFRGSGVSEFSVQGTVSGNIAAGQVVQLGKVFPTGSFTNHGTILTGSITMPAGDTITNEGTWSIDRGESLIKGNIDNGVDGVMGEEGALSLIEPDTTFTNEGVLYLLFPAADISLDGCDCGPDDNQFVNTGKIYAGVRPNESQWGGVTLASTIVGSKSETVNLGGEIIPVPNGEPPTPPESPAAMDYGLTGSPGTPANWTLTCPGSATDGWELDCSSFAKLVDPSNASLVPTEITVAGSGTVAGDGWTSAYGKPVTLTATITAQSGAAPTGDVTFFGLVTPTAGTNPAYLPGDLLGTAPLTTKDGVTTATLTLDNLEPTNYMLQALYPGSVTDLPCNSAYGTEGDQVVTPSATTTTVSARPDAAAFGTAVRLAAHITPAVVGVTSPTGSVVFTASGAVLGTAQATTAGGKTVATLETTAPAIGSTQIVAEYEGDYDYTASNSAPVTVTTTAGKAPRTVTVKGPSKVQAGTTYSATARTNGSGSVLFGLAASPAPPGKMTINSATGKVTFKAPRKGPARFSYAVMASSAEGRAESSVVTVNVTGRT